MIGVTLGDIVSGAIGAAIGGATGAFTAWLVTRHLRNGD